MSSPSIDCEPLTEHIRDWRTTDLKVDSQARRVQNLVLCGAHSRNGYRYSTEAMQAAATLYERKPVFLDHAANTSRPYERSTRDLVGMVQNARYDAEHILGDIQVLDTEAGRTFLALLAAENSPVGLSHVVLAQRGPQSQLVEKIHDVVSVDAVVFPATTRGWRESTEALWPGSWEAVVEQIDALLPAHLSQLDPSQERSVRRVAVFGTSLIIEQTSAEGTPSQCAELSWSLSPQGVVLGDELRPVDPTDLRTQASIGELHEQLRSTRAEVQRLEKCLREQHDAEQLEALLSAAHLPAFAMTDAFRQQLATSPDADRRRQLITERQQLIERAMRPAVASRARLVPSSSGDGDFVRAVRGIRGGVLCGQA
ncbi:hypothetical protein GC163_07785 [bacterium]|nr:hypothetical protein [bacterium]